MVGKGPHFSAWKVNTLFYMEKNELHVKIELRFLMVDFKKIILDYPDGHSEPLKFCCSCFKTRSHEVALVGLELAILCPEEHSILQSPTPPSSYIPSAPLLQYGASRRS